METLALILLLGLLDRLRGDTIDLLGINTSHIKISTDRIAYAWAIAVLVGYGSLFDPITWLIMLGMYFGMGLGWGEPYGSYIDNRPMRQDNLEKWQFGIFKTNVKLALVFRGALWGIFIAPAAYFDPKLWIVFAAYTVAFPLALILAKKLNASTAWPVSETFRGWMAGAIISTVYW